MNGVVCMLAFIAYLFTLIFGLITLPLDNLIVKIICLVPFLIWQLLQIQQNPKKYGTGFSIGTVLLISFTVLGAVWKDYLSFASFLMYGFGVFLSFLAMIFYILFIFATNKKEKEVVLSRKEDKKSFREVLTDAKDKLASFKKFTVAAKKHRKEGNSWLFSLQLATVEKIEMNRPVEKNAMDFTFLKEIKHERNEQTLDS